MDTLIRSILSVIRAQVDPAPGIEKLVTAYVDHAEADLRLQMKALRDQVKELRARLKVQAHG